MLFINNLNVQYGAKHLFRNISARINDHDRIGLVGVNGSGKSTLLQIAAGLIETDSGTVVRAKRSTIGYLAQEITSIPAGRTVFEEAQSVFAELLAELQELDLLNRQLSAVATDQTSLAALLKRQGELQHRLEEANIFGIRSQIEKILMGLGFKLTDLDKPCEAFSGGWIMRLMLAKLLLGKPSLLLLDEPTNHLDFGSLTWVEEYLKAHKGALVIVSHDRTFLDNTTNTTWELSLGKLTVYRGNYSKYVKDKENRLHIQRAAYANQQAQIQQTMRFVERFRAKSTKASQVQSRLKQLERMDKVELEESEDKIIFRFPSSPPSGRIAFEVEGLCKNYDGQLVLHNLTFGLQRGEKLAIIGANGAGKSTLVRILAGIEPFQAGKVTLGHNVKRSYFGQHQAQELSPGYTVLETLSQIDTGMTFTQIRSLLGAFLFSGDTVDKKVQVLSGGEKSRLALARMIATPANLLILDEPTNHLDMSSQEILQEAMLQYDGTIVVVSHNRFFLNGFVTRVLEVRDAGIILFEGNLDDYWAKISERPTEEKPLSGREELPRASQNGEAAKNKGKAARQEQAKTRQEKGRRLAPLKDAIARLEKEIDNLETRKSALEELLADPELYRDQEAFSEKSKEYGKTVQRLEVQYSEWENIQTRIAAVEAELAGL